MIQIYTELPGFEELIQLELLARKKGSEINQESLLGLWKFVSVWKEGKTDADLISSSMLRFLSANLEFVRNQIKEELPLLITNSVSIGLFSIEFTGRAELRGRQPILTFFFDRLEVKLGQKILFIRLLTVPKEDKRPFFAVIAMEPNGQWLAARGRGGGLALWIRD